MIITRAPLRITFGGGGTDLPSYYSKYGGELVAAAIDKYIYIAVHKAFHKELIIKYSQYERVKKPSEILHPIIREVLTSRGVETQTEIVSFADIPDGTGLGSSSAFTVALLKAICHYKREPGLVQRIAEEACDIEINRLGNPIGKQDQYTAAYGGICRYRFNPDGSVDVEPLKISSKTLAELEDNLLLFFTGVNRSASAVLADQKIKTEENNDEMIQNLHHTKELGIQSCKALESGDLVEFARLMHVHWENKRKRSQGISKSEIDKAYDIAMENGALGGKLIGAGGGGFLMFYTKDHDRVRLAMSKQGLSEVRFKFDFEGVRALHV